MEFKEPDRIPIYDLLNNPLLYELYGGRGNQLCRAVNTYKEFGIDMTRFHVDFDENWVQAIINEWDHYMGVDKNKWGVEASSGTYWISKRPFNDIKGLKKNLPRSFNKDQLYKNYVKGFRKVRDAFAPEVMYIGAVEGCVTNAFMYSDLQLFCEAIFDAPDIVSYLLDLFADWAFTVAKAYAENELGLIFFIGDDIAYKTSLIFSLDFLRKEFIPRTKYIIEPLKKHGIKVMYHSDGNLDLILDDLVNELNIDGLNPIEVAAGMNLIDLRHRYPKLLLFGGVDVSELLPFGTPEQIENEVRKIIKEIGKYSGLFLGTSTEMHEGVPLENVRTFYDAIRKYGRYPLNWE
ncbi:MAG: hypothetical protein M1371_03765 [Actinobacteria bacterium]|nr:hypothetical protein [Actinomycetota bacterium]